jgi:hypothetical protein
MVLDQPYGIVTTGRLESRLLDAWGAYCWPKNVTDPLSQILTELAMTDPEERNDGLRAENLAYYKNQSCKQRILCILS